MFDEIMFDERMNDAEKYKVGFQRANLHPDALRTSLTARDGLGTLPW
jgi:hypothetical protein